MSFASHRPAQPLLAPDEPHPLEMMRPEGRSDFVLICEHAGRRIPQALGTLGLAEEDRARHIAWDIGAREVAVALSGMLDAPLFMQRYSRLVCDCNRRPDVATFIPEIGERTAIPGNVGLSEADRRARAEAIFQPFHDAVTVFLDGRARAGRRTILATVHSFTPVFLGRARPWQVGILFNRDRLLGPAIAGWLKENTGLEVGVNEPYSVGDETDYAIPVHGEKRGLPCVEFEIRHDLITEESKAQPWAELLAKALAAGREALREKSAT